MSEDPQLTPEEQAIEDRKRRSLELQRRSFRADPRLVYKCHDRRTPAPPKTAKDLPESGTIWQHRITGERRMVINEVTPSGRELFSFCLPYHR